MGSSGNNTTNMRLITIGSLTFVFLAGAHAWTSSELLPKSHQPELEALVQDLPSTHTAQKQSAASARWGRVLTDLRKALKTPQLPEIAPASTDSAPQATESSRPQVNQLREPSALYDATGWDRVIDRQQVDQLREPSASYDATGWDRVIDRHRTLGWDRIIDRHSDLNAGERVSTIEPLIGSGKAKPEVEVAAPVLKQMAAGADSASSSKAPDEAGWFRGSAVAESANNWFKGQSEGTLDDQPSNEQHMRVSEDLPEVQQNVEAEATLVRQVHQVKARLTATAQHKETQHKESAAELQTARAKEQQLHTQRWCRVNCCGAAKFG